MGVRQGSDGRYSRQWLVDLLRRMGMPEAADDAMRTLPETFEREQLEEFGNRHGISRSEIEDRMGGSP